MGTRRVDKSVDTAGRSGRATPIVIVCFLFACRGFAQQTTLTLEQAEEIALHNHPRIAASQWNELVAAQAAAQLRSGLYPQVSGLASAAGAPGDTRIGAGGINNPIVLGRLAAGIAVNQMLYDGGRTRLLEQSAIERTRGVQAETRFNRIDVLLAVRQAFFSVLRAKATLGIARETVKLREVLVDQVRALQQAQLKSALDLSFSEVSLSEARLLLAAATNDESAASADLASSMGVPDISRYELQEPSVQEPAVSEQDAYTIAAANRPDLQARKQEVTAAQRLADAEKRLRRPSIGLAFTAGGIPVHVSDIRRDDYVAGGVTVSLPFLNGGLIAAREREAEYRVKAAEERVRELENRLRRDVRVAFLNVQAARARVELTKQYVDSARQALELAQARYDLGLSSIVELSQAQYARTAAEIQQVAAGYDLQTRLSTLAFQTGLIR